MGEQKWWGLPQFNFMSSSFFKKKEKNEKSIFARISGEQGGRRMRDALECNFCVCNANLLLTSLFLILESILVLQFQMKNLGRMTSAEELN